MTHEPRCRETIVFETPLVRIGAFRCDAGHAAFARSAPIVNDNVWFARTPIVIAPEHARPFVANANCGVFYNRGESFGRKAIGPYGDSSDWFAVSEALAADIADRYSALDRSSRQGPFRAYQAPVDSEMYLRQRQLFEQTASDLDALTVEERVIGIIDRMVSSAAASATAASAERVSARLRDRVRDVEQMLSQPFDQSLSLDDVSRHVSLSPFYLCRLFRSVTGMTLHRYRLALRLRGALEPVVESTATLTQIAQDFGFPSHSHFTAAFRREFGVVPSSLRHIRTPARSV